MGIAGKIPNQSTAGSANVYVYNDGSATLDAFRPVQWDRIGDHALSVKAPAEPGLLVDFAGVPQSDLTVNDQTQIPTAGMMYAYVLATATTTSGSCLYPVTVSGSSYMKESKSKTFITLLEDITASSGSQVLAKILVERHEADYAGIERIRHDIWRAPATATTTYVHAAAACDTSEQTISTSITNPDVPRNVTATTAGTSGDVAAVSVIVTGTDCLDQAITETLPAFTVNTNGTVTGSKAFKTVTSYLVPAMDGTGCTVSVGIGDKLGLIDAIQNTALVKSALLAGVLEGTAPTLTGSTYAGAIGGVTVSSSTADLNSALNATQVDVFYYA